MKRTLTYTFLFLGLFLLNTPRISAQAKAGFADY